jgi:Spy/CpxP family protein refolding chaperone
MKKMIAALGVVALSGTMAIAAANDGGGKAWGHGHRHGAMAMHLAQKLNLTDAQKEQLKSIHQSFRQENQAFLQSVRQTRQDLRAAKQAGDEAKVNELKAVAQSQHAQMKQLRQAQHDKFLTILTPEQRTQLDALKAEREARRQEHQQKQK